MSKRIFITGGAKGIGKAIVQAFSKENNQVAFCDIDVDAGKILSESTNSRFFKASSRAFFRSSRLLMVVIFIS